jgi:hypothetical protein
MTDGHNDSDIDAGLEAAFGGSSGTGASMLGRIQRLTGIKSELLLHDGPDEDDSPLTHVHRLTRDEEGAEDDSRYQVAGEIAKGGVGVVYKCRDRDLGRDVAVKVLRQAPTWASRTSSTASWRRPRSAASSSIRASSRSTRWACSRTGGRASR